jgi:hypothetical protein
MAASAADKRSVAVQLVADVTTFKASIDAINTVTSAWTLDDADNTLPTGSVIKAQLAAFDALTKPVVSLTASLAAIRAET